MTLKQRTVTGLIWSFVDSVANLGVQFVVGVVLARILSPHEFGLIGMLTILIAISQSFIDSGFSLALIRKKECTQTDYSTIFFFNLGVSILFYVLLFILSGAVSSFFDEPQLKPLLQVLGIGLIFNSFGIIQRTIHTKNINFKLQTKVSSIASLVSGIIAITMAVKGFGVWSLVALALSRFALTSIFLWIYSDWKPTLVFCKKSFSELFYFGSKLLLSGLIDTAYRNIYYLVIGKYFSAVELGFYTRADQFQAFPSSNLQSIIGRVSYPMLSSIQDNIPRLKLVYVKMIRITMLITFVLMLGMAAIAKPMILTLIGDKWEPSIIYLQMLCFVGMLYPLHSLNLNILQVLGRSDLFLKIEIIKKILAIPIIIISVFFGIKAMIIGMMILSLIAYYLNSYWSGKMIGYPTLNQLRDIMPSFILALLINGLVYSISYFEIRSTLVELIVQIFAGAMLTIVICEGIKFKDYIYLKNIIMEKLYKRY